MKTFRNVFRKAFLLSAGLVLMGGVFTACKKDNADEYTKPEATLSPADGLSFTAEGGEKVVTLDSNRDWTASSSQETWLTVSPASGKAGNGKTLTVTALPNKTTVAREANVTVKLGSSLVKTLKVTQAAAEQSEPGEMPKLEGMSLADFLAKYGAVTADTEVTEEDFIQAVVISDLKANNVPNNKLLTVQAGDKGLVLVFPKQLNPKGQEPLYQKGDLLKINLKGTKVTVKYGLQLDVSAEGAVEKVGTMDIQPISVSLEDVFSGKYQNVLVQIDGVQFKKATGKLNDLKPTDKSKYPVKFHELTDCVTKPADPVKGISVAISYFATDLKKEDVSDKKGTMLGILARSNGRNGEVYYNLWIRDVNDLKLTAEPCKVQGEAPAPSPTPEPARKVGLDDFVQRYEGKTVEDNVYVEGSILVEIAKDNYKPNSLTIQQGEDGLTIYLPGLDQTVVKDLKRFAVVKIMAKGGKLERYNGGGLQLSFPQGTDAKTIVSSLGKITEVMPKAVELRDVYSGKYENVLVRVTDVQFEKKGGVLAQYNNVTDCFAQVSGAGEQGLQVNIAAKSSLTGTAIPEKRGTMTGVLTRSANSKKQYFWNLWVRDMNDLDLKADRCGETAPVPIDPEPTPGPGGHTDGELPPVNPDGDLMFVSYVMGKSGTHRYIAIYNPTDKDIDLSGYGIQAEVFKNDNKEAKPRTNPSKAPKQLEGILGSRKVKVYGPSRDALYTGEFDKGLAGLLGAINGNDNVALFKDGKRIDIIGVWGGAWVNSVRDSHGLGTNKTLHRKFDINSPNKSFTFDEWETYTSDYISRLGKRW